MVAAMAPLLDRSVHDLLEDVADATPAPGGGSSAALTCALAAGLVQMVVALTLRRGDPATPLQQLQQVHERAGALRAHAGELGEAELHAYAPVLEALRRPADDPARGEQVAAALSGAAESPLAIVRAAAEVAGLGADAVRLGAKPLRGDAITGVLLAEAAAAAAARLVTINLAGRPDDERLVELDGLTRTAAQIRNEVLR
jgi:formiminotetrahydrofolate cyclodeaminase